MLQNVFFIPSATNVCETIGLQMIKDLLWMQLGKNESVNPRNVPDNNTVKMINCCQALAVN